MSLFSLCDLHTNMSVNSPSFNIFNSLKILLFSFILINIFPTFLLQPTTHKDILENLPHLNHSDGGNYHLNLNHSDSDSFSHNAHQINTKNNETKSGDQMGIEYKVLSFRASDRVKGSGENIAQIQKKLTKTATLTGIRVESSRNDVQYKKGSISYLLADSKSTIRLFGNGFTKETLVKFTTEGYPQGSPCNDLASTKDFEVSDDELMNDSAIIEIQLPDLGDDADFYYFCIKEKNGDSWVHQGKEDWVTLSTYKSLLPIWVHVILLTFLLVFSGLFSGLNLGLMAIDRTDMKVIMSTGTKKERQYAKAIQPLRNNGNYLLCSLLLGNVLVNSSLTILLDGLTSGLIAVAASTFGIVIFGEIIPQAICSRHGLAVGAKTIWITKFFMAVTFPISYPISVILDKALGEEIGNVYNRERLKELIKVTREYNDLEHEEVNIISGALELRHKIVGDVMTKLDEVFMLPINSLLDFDTVSEIMSQGYSRIPVFDRERSNIVSLLYAKDLAFVDPDDTMPLKSICEFYCNTVNFVFETTTLDVIFKDFKQGNKGHMAFVQKFHSGETEDPYYETIGVITMEDVIEALIQAEINDETDVYDKRRKSQTNSLKFISNDMSIFKKPEIRISSQLVLAAFQYLTTSIEQFHPKRISAAVLHKLLQQNIFLQIKINKNDTKLGQSNTILYERGKPADYFILILEGRVISEIGNEKLIFESGPFTFFGTQSLDPNSGGEFLSTPSEIRKLSNANNSIISDNIFNSFIPDYTVSALTDVIYLRINRTIYIATIQATALEKTMNPGDTNKNTDDFEEHIGKMISDENMNIKNKEKLLIAKMEKGDDEGMTNYGINNFSEIILTPEFLSPNNNFERRKKNSLNTLVEHKEF